VPRTSALVSAESPKVSYPSTKFFPPVPNPPRLFTETDLLEQNQAYIDKAKQLLTPTHRGEFYTAGCQDFVYTRKYDVIWIQWVIGHLTDKDCVEYLKKSKAA
jgi:hypothetical protein